MATNILTDQSLAAEGVVYSTEVSNVSNIDIQALLAAESAGQVQYTIQRKTANGDWRTAKDENGNALKFTTTGDTDDGINLIGVNAAKLRVKVAILSGSSGTLNLEYESV